MKAFLKFCKAVKKMAAEEEPHAPKKELRRAFRWMYRNHARTKRYLYGTRFEKIPS